MTTVLVTGGSGYVGTQLVAALLRAGRPVRATMRLVIHNDRAREELGWRPRPVETTIVESAESLPTSACWRTTVDRTRPPRTRPGPTVNR